MRGVLHAQRHGPSAGIQRHELHGVYAVWYVETPLSSGKKKDTLDKKLPLLTLPTRSI